jgi:Protein of unknown function (DUF2934)
MADNTSPTQPSEEQIRLRAYEIYAARAGREGDAVSDWLTAERELKVSNDRAKKTRAAAASL